MVYFSLKIEDRLYQKFGKTYYKDIVQDLRESGT